MSPSNPTVRIRRMTFVSTVIIFQFLPHLVTGSTVHVTTPDSEINNHNDVPAEESGSASFLHLEHEIEHQKTSEHEAKYHEHHHKSKSEFTIATVKGDPAPAPGSPATPAGAAADPAASTDGSSQDGQDGETDSDGEPIPRDDDSGGGGGSMAPSFWSMWALLQYGDWPHTGRYINWPVAFACSEKVVTILLMAFCSLIVICVCCLDNAGLSVWRWNQEYEIEQAKQGKKSWEEGVEEAAKDGEEGGEEWGEEGEEWGEGGGEWDEGAGES